MTLSQYLEQHGMTDAQFAEKIGVERSTVTRLRAGQMPSSKTLLAIIQVTEGEVSANDFFVKAA